MARLGPACRMTRKYVTEFMKQCTKKASGTTSFIVIFSSLAGFLGHTAMGHINVPLLALSALGSIAGAYLGSWLLARKLQSAQVKTIIGVVLYVIAARMLWGLMG
jgi:uncharacterized membrane protein YfcA